MDQVKEFFQNLTNRFSSPFIFSFAISWLLWNWHIIIPILFYDHQMLKMDGFKTYNDLIEHSINLWVGLIGPLFSAIGYIIFHPVINGFIQIFNVWIDKIIDKKNHEILADTQISIEKYMQRARKVEEQKKELERLISQERDTTNDLSKEIEEQKHKNQEMAEELRLQQKLFNDLNKNTAELEKQSTTLSGFFSGEWICEREFFNPSSGKEEKVFEIFMVEDTDILIDNQRINVSYITCTKKILLQFSKSSFENNSVSTVTQVLRLTVNYWVGFEQRTANNFDFVRYYPKNKPPDHYFLFKYDKDWMNNIKLI